MTTSCTHTQRCMWRLPSPYPCQGLPDASCRSHLQGTRLGEADRYHIVHARTELVHLQMAAATAAIPVDDPDLGACRTTCHACSSVWQ